jgi:ATP-dependent Lon protease
LPAEAFLLIAEPATLFYNKASRKLGVIGLKHLVFFDEIANTRFDDAEASISVLKDYMQTGKFSRGDQEFSSSCSVILGGNIDTNLELRQPEPRYLHLFQVLPVELQDPGWIVSTPTCRAGRCRKSAQRITPWVMDC